MIELSVAEIRAELARAAGTQAGGAGEPSTMLLGRVFHEVFADLVSADPTRSGLRIAAEGGSDPKRCEEQLLDHVWHRLLAPRLLRHGAVLQGSSASVMMLWKAAQNLTSWLSSIVAELMEQQPALRGGWEHLAKALQAEVPLRCELKESRWTEPVQLHGFADSVLRVPGREAFCAVELKLGRASPSVDLGQAALYHLMLTRSTSAPRSALALMRFSPDLDETLVDDRALDPAIERLLELIGRVAGVIRDESAVTSPMPVVPPTSPTEAHVEIGKRLVRAYREHGVGIEVRGAPMAGPRFLRFDVRLSAGMRLDGLRKRTREVQHRLALCSEPLIVPEAGHLYVDIERPDKETVLFSSIRSKLPTIDSLHGSAKILIGTDAAHELRYADLSSSGRSHVLAAGATGSGKSEWLRMMLASLIASNTPDTLRIVTFDPKLAAFADLEKSKFLWKPDAYWVTGEKPASELFQDLIEEMERRYQLTRQSGTDNLRGHVEKTGKPLARIVCVCDEYYSLISQNKQEKAQIEEAVSLLGAKARAAGVHLVLATQQPSRQTITGAIQTNLPCRVALSLGSHIESNMILGAPGAERLTGSGDLLYKDFGDPVRLQAPYLTDDERRRWFRT